MKISTPYKKLFSVDINEIKPLIINISNEEWNSWSIRQERYGVHSHTKSYPLLFWSNFDSFWNDSQETNLCVVDEMNRNSPLWNKTRKIIKELENYYGGICTNAIFTKLIARGEIPCHKDKGHFLEISHRCHIPIKTNKNVLFSIDNKVFNFSEGYVYEISNMDLHCVKNNSDEDRIHLIIDIIDESLPIKYSLK